MCMNNNVEMPILIFLIQFHMNKIKKQFLHNLHDKTSGFHKTLQFIQTENQP